MLGIKGFNQTRPKSKRIDNCKRISDTKTNSSNSLSFWRLLNVNCRSFYWKSIHTHTTKSMRSTNENSFSPNYRLFFEPRLFDIFNLTKGQYTACLHVTTSKSSIRVEDIAHSYHGSYVNKQVAFWCSI